jgi:transposase
MGNRKELSIEDRTKILCFRQNTDMSMRAISDSVGCSVSCVKKTLDRYRESNSLDDRPRSGRPKVMTHKDERYVKLLSKRDRFKTLPVLQEEFNCGRIKEEKVCKSVLRKALIKNGLSGRVAAKKPLLRAQNIKKRLAFAKAHVNWSNEQWSRVLFTDESKFEFFGNKRRMYVRRFENERFKNYCLKPTMKHGGGSVMVWGGISVRGVTRLKLIIGKMDSKAYKYILQYNVLPDGKRLLGKGFILQQDNDPKHKEKRVMRYLNNKQNDGNYLFLIATFSPRHFNN